MLGTVMPQREYPSYWTSACYSRKTNQRLNSLAWMSLRKMRFDDGRALEALEAKKWNKICGVRGWARIECCSIFMKCNMAESRFVLKKNLFGLLYCVDLHTKLKPPWKLKAESPQAGAHGNTTHWAAFRRLAEPYPPRQCQPGHPRVFDLPHPQPRIQRPTRHLHRQTWHVAQSYALRRLDVT
jgi:hypothetical protein